MKIFRTSLAITNRRRRCSHRYFSSEISAGDRMVLGTHKWQTMEPSKYVPILQAATANGVSHVEVDSNANSEVLSQITSSDATILMRVGYRTIKESDFKPLDVHVEDLAEEKVVHNIGAEYIESIISEKGNVVPLLHNPEVQAVAIEEESKRQERIQDRLATALATLEAQCENNSITSYGICSNGLCLPPSHPMYLSLETLVNATQQAKAERLAIVQLPANAVETKGLDIAHQLKEALPQVELHCQRPLSCYPHHFGTGIEDPLVLADYHLPASMEKTKTWSNLMTRPPEVYHVALQTAMRHFDAQDLLEAQKEGEPLTPEQRETLDGCKLLQSLLHDLDRGLVSLQSFRAHEQELYQRVIPLIHDTFESYDQDTSNVLQSFFSAYSLAVRYSIAKHTREYLVGGEVPKYSNLAEDVRLQEFGLQHVMEPNVFDRVVVGCTQVDHVMDNLDILHRWSQDDK